MEQIGDLLTPWLTLGAILVPLIYVEKWIHSHLYGVGWLLTADDRSATALYYVLLFPGVFVHEFVQYLVAGALNVRIKRVIAWPDAQKDGTLRLDFVRIQEANWLQAAIIGAAPLIAGLALVWLISSQVLSLDQVVTAIQAQDSDLISAALKDLASTPDFFLWIYLVFTISNAMLPTPADRQGWPLLIVAFAAVIGFLVVIGVGDVLYEQFTGPFAQAVDRITLAFASVLVVEIPGIIFIGFLEEVLEHFLHRKFTYNREQAPTAASSNERTPGSNLPLPPGVPLPSIYHLDLPLPDPPKGSRKSARRSKSPAVTSPAPTATSSRTTERGERVQPSPSLQSARAADPRRATPVQEPSPPEPTSAAARRSTPATPDERSAARRATPVSDQPSPGTTPPRAAPVSDRSEPERRSARIAGSEQPAQDRRAERAQPPVDERRARPEQPDARRAQAENALEQRARPVGPPPSPDRTRPPTRTDPPDRQERRPPPVEGASRGAAGDTTQRLGDTQSMRDQFGRPGQISRRAPDSATAPDPRARRPAPLADSEAAKDDAADNDLRYESDPDVVQDIPDDDLI